MNLKITILLLTLLFAFYNYSGAQTFVQFDFCGQQLLFSANKEDQQYLSGKLSQEEILSFYNNTLHNKYDAAIRALKEYKENYKPDDWLYYQLIRKMAESISPKENNYFNYTLYKWFLLTQSGYDAMIAITPAKMLFYIQCDENIYNIPSRMKNGRQYICLNYHDYKNIDFIKENFTEVPLPPGNKEKTFSYKVTKIPDIQATEYLEKDLHFTYNDNEYHFKLKLTPQIQKLFINYPVVDYAYYMNIPLSREAYNSLIPQLRKSVKGMKIKNGVDFIMRFTRYAFLFEPDSKHFGGEKRLSPEQTLFYDQSDCEDRVALFFCLVKEIYNLPMIVLSYPEHITIAVSFNKPSGESIIYNGQKYSICEPTPQKTDLTIGQSLASLRGTEYEIVYHYSPIPQQ